MRKIFGPFVFYWDYRREEPAGDAGRVWGITIGTMLIWYVKLDPLPEDE